MNMAVQFTSHRLTLLISDLRLCSWANRKLFGCSLLKVRNTKQIVAARHHFSPSQFFFQHLLAL